MSRRVSMKSFEKHAGDVRLVHIIVVLIKIYHMKHMIRMKTKEKQV